MFYEPTFNLSTMMQAAARSYRMNQKRDCRVVYLFYTGSMEHHAIQLMSRKQRAAKMVNGEIGLSGLDALTSGESGLEEALLRMLGREEALINPADLFKREALNPLDAADADFWQAAVTPITRNEPAVIIAPPVMLPVSTSEAPRRDPLLSVATELGATVTPIPLAQDEEQALPVRLMACLNAAHILPERQARLEARLLTALTEGTPTGDTTPEALTHWIAKLLRVEKAVAPEHLPDLVVALIALTAKPPVVPVVTRPTVPVLLPKAAASTKGPSKPKRKPDLMAVPDERPIAPVAAKSPTSRPQRSVAPSRQQLLFDLPHVHA